MELCLYNAVLTSMSSDGKTFTYINQLASSDTDLSKREEWFTCACCPPNVFRLLGQIGGYIWSTHSRESSVEVAVHLFISSILRLGEDGIDLEVTQESNWPWSGEITFSVKGSADVELRIRIPTWAEEWRVSSLRCCLSTLYAKQVQVIPEPPRKELEKGYLSLPATWLKQNPSFTLSIPLQCRIITPHPFTNQDTVSVARGPIVYCVEDFDNPWVEDHFKVRYDLPISLSRGILISPTVVYILRYEQRDSRGTVSRCYDGRVIREALRAQCGLCSGYVKVGVRTNAECEACEHKRFK